MAWTSLCGLAWANDFTSSELVAARTKYLSIFLRHGIPREIGLLSLEPPTRVCVDPGCAKSLQSNPSAFCERELVEPSRIRATIYTKEFGSIPGFSTSRYCRNCHTRYYHSYYVHRDASLCTFYPTQDPILNIGLHFFVDREMCELFSIMMVNLWTSATNCARIYNEGLQNNLVKPFLPADWPFATEIDVEHVWDAFYYHNLLLDHERRSSLLVVPNLVTSQAERLRPALLERNRRMVGPGQDAWNHACDDCCAIFKSPGQPDDCTVAIRSVVTDGVEMGRPCCSVHDCLEPLPTNKHRYCTTHSNLNLQCAVKSCVLKAEEGFKTCRQSDHCDIETYHLARGKAMFQLKSRLQRLKISQLHDSLPHTLADQNLEGSAADLDEGVDINVDGICEGKPDGLDHKSRKKQARFGRTWTHNEQLAWSSCGVCLGRATFYGSEAPNGVRSFWKKLWPTKRSLPEVLWYDNNC
ncbi:unnamed protein product [Mycena citricolor]|uniref:CxC6 like cysteine cluster associated with KDZ domain-containing protein n=1 Tax=Mycena citricolor TaxID=2018698 RepID=A0AAD2H0Q2_9AGAR|nr:unnamed protein product [Mycena citricolor]